MKKLPLPTQDDLEKQYRSISACKAGTWSILTWKKDGTGTITATPFRCKSWRHSGECRAWCGACDFARISTAIAQHDGWVYINLTYPHHDWPRVAELFRFGVVSWSRLRKRLTREYGPIKYIQTWEIHKSGYPHLNVLVCNRVLFDRVHHDAAREKRTVLVPGAVACGFGKECWLESMRDRSRMAGYLTKLALELTGADIKDQVPVNAPPHFRRIRASRGLLPKRIKDDTITGTLSRFSAEEIGTHLGLEKQESGKWTMRITQVDNRADGS